MAARDRFSKKITCPQCGHTGIADISETDDPHRKTPGFAVDHMPTGFETEKSSAWPETYIVRCGCGRKFPFLQVAVGAVAAGSRRR